ncbi:MAG: iron dicitrate transport regulator FecR [Bacteroidetes bacterium]|jgi:ferric-dicitrate binding protein FerR (iron transport regulator)|nr:iron dicitrate transport regulator FecR [Bacteroidota bacterium]
MNRDDERHIPEELRDRLAEERAEEQANLERVWHMFGDVELTNAAPSSEETWAAIQDRLGDRDSDRADRAPRTRQRHRSWRTWGGVAAAVLLLILAGAFLWRQPVEVTAPAGEQVPATLPDGSTVELNSGTTLSHRRGFSAWPFVPAEQRIVRLQGEAYFDVQRGPRPFVVETFNARIDVLGTQFNVRARAKGKAGETHVTLAEGRVRVRAGAPSDDKEAVVLDKPGQSSRVAASAPTPTAPRATDVNRALAWRTQGFAVSDWPLGAIFDELERRHDVHITVRSPAVQADSMTLYYPKDTEVETIIHDIAVAKGLSYRATSQGYEITDQ